MPKPRANGLRRHGGTRINSLDEPTAIDEETAGEKRDGLNSKPLNLGATDFPRDSRQFAGHFPTMTTAEAAQLLDQFRAGKIPR
ncbi:MAG TPA: hypothetical protein DCQ92_16025, partial [Verrucomicrobia subdivision 3 bacterium]|nr:hypothetical protein [Limisphaerales bacterium]